MSLLSLIAIVILTVIIVNLFYYSNIALTIICIISDILKHAVVDRGFKLIIRLTVLIIIFYDYKEAFF